MYCFPAVSNSPNRDSLFAVADQSYGGFLAGKWLAICGALGFVRSDAQPPLDILLRLIDSWGDRRIGAHNGYRSFVSGDGFPAEFSVSWRLGRPEVRILFESLGDGPTARSCQDAGRALTRELAAEPGVSIKRYLAVEDLFLAAEPAPYRPTIWHSLAWRPGEKPRYKVYLNPQVCGIDRAADLVTEAMRRLGLEMPWRTVLAEHVALIERGHRLEFFALDLDAEEPSRVKIYYRHPEVDLAELDRVAALACRHDSARARAAYRAVYGTNGAIGNEPMTCLSFQRGAGSPVEANVYLRLTEAARSDAEAADRVRAVLAAEGIDPHRHTAMLHALAPAPLAETAGLQELLSYRTTGPGGPADVAVYFRFSVHGPRS
nr:tryptophan dimethylallyltransferase family protein [Amycolatopsis nigrescens]